MPYNCKLFVLRIITWSYNCLQRIIIIISYLKPYDCVQKNDYYLTEIITWNHIIIGIKLEHLKPYNCENHLYYIGILHHHHHIALVARISLTLSRHSSLSFIALGRSSGQHPVSSHSCWMYVRAGRPAFARPCVGIHKSTSLMSSSLLLQQCPACLVRLTWIVFVIGGRWPYSWCLVGCCCQVLEYLISYNCVQKIS